MSKEEFGAEQFSRRELEEFKIQKKEDNRIDKDIQDRINTLKDKLPKQQKIYVEELIKKEYPLSDGEYKDLIQMLNSLTPQYLEIVNDIIKREMRKLILGKNFYNANKFLNWFSNDEKIQLKICQSPEIFPLVIKEFLKELSHDDCSRDVSLMRYYFQGQESIYLSLIKKELLNKISRGRYYFAQKMLHFFADTKTVLSDNEIVLSIKKAIIHEMIDSKKFSNEKIKNADDIIKYFPIPKKEVDEAIVQGIISCFSTERIEIILKIINKFMIDKEELLRNSKVIEAAKTAVLNSFRQNRWDDIKITRNEFLPDISEENYDKIFNDIWQNAIDNNNIDFIYSLRFKLMIRQKEYQELIQKLKTEIIQGKNKPARQKAIEILTGLAKLGDTQIAKDFIEILGKKSTKEEIEKNKLEIDETGLTSEQKMALRVLMELDNPDVNSSLWSLLFNENIDPHVKKIILNNLTKKGYPRREFKEVLEKLLTQDAKEINYGDFSFINDVNNIASADLRQKAQAQMFSGYDKVYSERQSIYKVWLEKFGNIPQDNFLQLIKFTNNDQIFLAQFNSHYQKIRKSSTKCEEMLFNITNANKIDSDLLSIISNKLKELGISEPVQFDNLSKVFKFLIFLDQIQKAVKYRYEEDEEGNWNDEDYQDDYQPTEEIKEINFSEIINQSKTLEELSNKLKQISLETIKNILPSEDLTIEKIENLWEKWKNLEPLFIHAGKIKGAGLGGTLKLIGEMASKMDPPNYEGWKTWRYNLDNEIVKNQIGHLSSEQQEIWKADYAAEIGELELAFTPTDKPERIFGEIKNAIEHLSDKKQFIRDYFSKLLTETGGDFAKTQTIIPKRLEELKNDLAETNNAIGLMEDEKNLSKLFGFMEKLKKKNKIDEINQNPQNVELLKKYNFTVNSTKEEFDRAVAKSKEDKQKILQEKILGIFKKYNVKDASNTNLYSTSKDLQILIQLLHLSNLTPQQLAFGKLTSDKKISIRDTLDKLKGQFRDEQAFLGYLENVNQTLSERGEMGKKRLAMIFTDNPQIGINIGKYPIGCGTCQNYEGDTGWNKALAGYMSDSHIKVCYLFDIDKLPEEIKKKIEDQGIGEVLSEIHPQDILNASLARSVIKIGKGDNNKPVIFSEPIYSVVNKGDLSMNNYFNIFLKTMLADEMKIKLYRGIGDVSITIPESKNPSGQYEDGGVESGGVGMGIQQGSYSISVGEVNLKQFNEKEQKIVESIRSSSR